MSDLKNFTPKSTEKELRKAIEKATICLQDSATFNTLPPHEKVNIIASFFELISFVTQ